MSQAKRFIGIAALSAALLGAGIVHAEPPWGGGDRERVAGGHEWGWHHPHHGLELHGVRLTDQQKEQFDKLKQDTKPAFEAKMKALHQTGESLRQAGGFANYNAAQVRQLADQQAKQLADLTVLKIELRHKAFALLTPEQQKQALEHEKKHQDEHEHHGE